MKKSFQYIALGLASFVLTITLTSSHFIQAHEEQPGYKLIHHEDLGVDVSVKANIDVDETLLTSLLIDIPAANRGNVQIEEIGGNDLNVKAITRSFSKSAAYEPFSGTLHYAVHYTHRDLKSKENH